MNLGAFFAALLALGPSDPVSNAELPVNPPHAVARTTLVAQPQPVQLAALPTDSDSATTPPAAPPTPPKVKPPQTATKKGSPPGTKPGTATAQRKPPPRKTQAAAKPAGKPTTTAAACPAGQVKSPSTGRCTARIKSATPPA